MNNWCMMDLASMPLGASGKLMRRGFLACHLSLMQSSTSAMRPVAITMLWQLVRCTMFHERWQDLLCNVRGGVDDILVADPHVTGRDPTSGFLISGDLVG